jgi:glutamate/tyrosine decarboxylase-like PLP-dependent enzyme
VGDLLASGLIVFAGSWLASPGPAELELATLGWLRDACRMPASAGGLFVSGGSVANLTALAVARGERNAGADAVLYCSDQTHSSIDRAVRVLGFSSDQLRKLPSDEHYRLDARALQAAIDEDRSRGRRPFAVVANAGTTNTGAVDPLVAIADLCDREELWLHADGAYGAAAVFSPEGRRLLEGIERVDSLSLDPHKWLFQPIECGCVLVREARMLRKAFEILPDYLKDVKAVDEEVNFRDYGIQLTRGLRALKLWMSFQVFGREAFSEAISAGLELARTAEALIARMPDWEVVTPAEMALVTFRYAPGGLGTAEADALTDALVGDAIRGGYAMLSSTRLDGRTALRLCTINPRTTEEDLRGTLDELDRHARRRLADRR